MVNKIMENDYELLSPFIYVKLTINSLLWFPQHIHIKEWQVAKVTSNL